MANRPVPVFTTGGPGVPSVRATPGPGATFYSAYTGTQLPGHPTFSTPTDDPTGRNPTYHGGISIGGDRYMVHRPKIGQ